MGQTVTLTATVTLSDGSRRPVTDGAWESDNSDVAFLETTTGEEVLLRAVWTGCLREGAKSYDKGLHVERRPARGHRYSPVRLMCSHPSGETWARNSAGTSRPARRLAKTASSSFSVFQ